MLYTPIISPALIKDLRLSSDSFYQQYLRKKMKYGAPQIDYINNSCRLRLINKPTYSLKMLQKEVKEYLNNFDLPNCMYGGISELNNIDNALEHIDNRFFLTIDLKNFFGAISNSCIYRTLTNLGFSRDYARSITRIATVNGCLPQGAPTSTILSNLAFAPTALLLESFCKQRDITFTVYIDDLSFSSTKCFKHYTKEIIEIIASKGFHVNHQKVHYRFNNCEVTGVIINKGELMLPKKVLKNINKPRVKQYITYFTNRYEKHLSNKKAALLS